MTVAEVKIWDELVGAVAWNEASGVAAFEFDPAFKRLGLDLSPIAMPVGAAKSLYEFPELRAQRQAVSDTFRGLPGLLADSLPDRYGKQLINTWLASQGRPQDSMNPVEMLCFIGSRGMGALEFEPSVLTESQRTFSVEIDGLVDLAQRMLSKRSQFKTNIQENQERAVLEILKIGTSAGGARPKALIAYNEKTGEVRSGQTRVPNGFGHWMIKLDGVSDVQLGASKGYGRVEMAYYLMATDCGIHMMPSELLEENGRAHFMTKRFDREGNETKHHVQTFCALKHFDFNLVRSFSYEQLFQAMRELKLTYLDAEQMFRRMVFNVIARNCDDHTKNFAFLMRKGKPWALAPAYDVCHAYRPESEWVSQHALSINGKREGITRKDLLVIGDAIKCKKAADIIHDIHAAVGQWNTYADQTRVSPKLRKEIGSTLLKLD